MKKKFETIIAEAMKAADMIRSASNIRAVSHYDADGITSAAISVRALEREGKPFHLTTVKQLSEEKVRELASCSADLVLITDTGAGFLDEIQEHIVSSGKKVVILDHHQTQGEIKPENKNRLVHVNPVVFGIEEDISGSGMTYLCMRALSPENRDLSELAIVGAIGDSQTGSIGPDWGLLGLNKEILKDAEITKKIKVMKGLRLWGRYTRPVHKALQFSMDPYIPDVSGSETGSVHFLQEIGIEMKKKDGSWRTLADLSEDETRRLASGIIKERIKSGSENPDWIFGDVYELLDKDEEFRDAGEFATMLNGCGKTGNSFVGIGVCLNDKGYYPEVRKILESYRREVGRAVDWIRKSKDIIRVTENADYIVTGSKVSEHIISNVVSIINRSCLVPDGDHKPVFAFADAEDGQVKISARMDDSLVAEGLNIKEILENTVKETGGEGGGHQAAGGATIPKERLDDFIRISDRLIGESLSRENPNKVTKSEERDTGLSLKEPEEPEKPPEPEGGQEKSPKKQAGPLYEKTSLISSLMDDAEEEIESGGEKTQNNLNSTEQNIEEQTENKEPNGESDVRKIKRPGEEREGAAGAGSQEKAGEVKRQDKGPVVKEVERKGLVRYFGA